MLEHICVFSWSNMDCFRVCGSAVAIVGVVNKLTLDE